MTSPSAIPKSLYDDDNAVLLRGILRGIEKESLRVTPDGHISLEPHPTALGSALTHPVITTDFSEALLEFITPPSHQIDTLLQCLRTTHQYTYDNIGSEALWPASMPCAVGNDADIPVARYGTSHRGKMKTTYRVGLGHRYGRTMQTVAGLHYNFSLPKSFWAYLHQEENSFEELSDFITRRYFDLIRNFRRDYWLLIYLFGASPAVCRSFAKGRKHNLVPLENDDHTLHLPYATSLRMGDLGYQSSAQESLFVCYNTSATYIKTLVNAIASPFPTYEDIGLYEDDGERRQLNTSLLQIENEFYSPIRPKRTAQSGETALTALCKRGVEYIEVRCIDLDPFSPVGITPSTIHFLDTFLLYCLFKDSPHADTEEFTRILRNQKTVVNEGRSPLAQLEKSHTEQLPLKTWAHAITQDMAPIAALLDDIQNTDVHTKALSEQNVRIDDPSQTPSAKVLAELTQNNIPYASWANQKAKQHKAFFDAQIQPDEDAKRFIDMADESLALQTEEEKNQEGTYEEYLARYYQQYPCCAQGKLEPV